MSIGSATVQVYNSPVVCYDTEDLKDSEVTGFFDRINQSKVYKAEVKQVTKQGTWGSFTVRAVCVTKLNQNDPDFAANMVYCDHMEKYRMKGTITIVQSKV